jgi:hypothetical protein
MGILRVHDRHDYDDHDYVHARDHADVHLHESDHDHVRVYLHYSWTQDGRVHGNDHAPIVLIA